MVGTTRRRIRKLMTPRDWPIGKVRRGLPARSRAEDAQQAFGGQIGGRAIRWRDRRRRILVVAAAGALLRLGRQLRARVAAGSDDLRRFRVGDPGAGGLDRASSPGGNRLAYPPDTGQCSGSSGGWTTWPTIRMPVHRHWTGASAQTRKACRNTKSRS